MKTIISDQQAQWMLTISSRLKWDYDAYTIFYAFMEKLTKDQRQDVIVRLSRR